jgi:Fe-S cluster assembly scaffold protein SufB
VISVEVAILNLDKLDSSLLNAVAGLTGVTKGAFSLRKDGQGLLIQSTENITITRKTDRPGIDVVIKPGTRGETVHVPVILTQSGLTDLVYNTFIVGEGAQVEIIAGCGIHNAGHDKAQHDGIHEFIVRRGASLRYAEKHYGEGEGEGKKVLNPTTIVTVEEGAHVEMEMYQVRGVDDAVRKTTAYVNQGGSLKVIERLLTHGAQNAESHIEIFMVGEDSKAQVLSRAVAQDKSYQLFKANLVGKAQCNGHVECDAIIMGSARIHSIPELSAESADAVLTHEAAIGRIAGEQVTKLMTLGLDENQAVDTIINGFLT